MQDILATLVAAIAFVILLRRTFGMFFSKDDSPACDGCSSCPPPVDPREPAAPAPMVFLRRSPSHDRR
jgi:hypothetical protein